MGMVEALTESELIRLGVQTIGDRLRLRSACLNSHTHPPDVEPGPSNSTRSASATRADSLADEIYRERTTLFGPYTRRSTRSRSCSNNRLSTVAGKKKRCRSWTGNFVCLAHTDRSTVPTATEREILKRAGLGKKKIKLDENADEQGVMDKIMSDEKNDVDETIGFPKLKDCGGIELLRTTQNCRNLQIIDSSWAVKDLKALLSPQANIYIRPIQKTLCTEPLPGNENSSNAVEVESTCSGCQNSFKLRELRKHVEVCPGPREMNSNPTDQDESTETIVIIVNGGENNGTAQSAVSVVEAVQEVRTPDQVTENEMEAASTAETQVNDISVELSDVHDIVKQTIKFCETENITDPTEILRKLQNDIVTGRPLEIEDTAVCAEGETNFILVDRQDLMMTGFNEIKMIGDPRKTLEVQFYGEVAADYGGPRKEFFRLIIIEIKEKYFDHGLRNLLSDEYETVGRIFALSILQNGKIPQFLDTDILFGNAEIESDASPCIKKLREGLDWLGLYEAVKNLPALIFLFHKSSIHLTFRMITSLFTPVFSDVGSNQRRYEQNVYAAFVRYLREVASGRRNGISLNSVLQFATGAEEEPLLGFKLHPSIEFTNNQSGPFIPTANTCINKLIIPRASYEEELPDDQRLFELYDYAFSNTYYGMF